MFLKSITLSGFKSFAPKTEVVFAVSREDKEDRFGITAVVGPNGSGKSNIADAVRWVMGEQSPKNLRGKSARDVIFSGSKAKGAMGKASVALHFDNSDRKIDADYSEVTVTRTMHKDGEGEYRINDSRVRLLDVVDLFATIGIGKESQCVLNQGMADAILSASPEDRRGILEEAAGVKPYRIKRDRAMKKLDRTRENLTVTAGLIEEIEPRLRLLKRQAKRAEQRKEVEEELRRLQHAYYARLWRELSEEKVQFDTVIAETGREVKMLERKLDGLHEKQQALSQKMQDRSPREKRSAEIASMRRKISELERKRSHLRGTIDAEIERFRNRKDFDIVPVDVPFVKKRLASLTRAFESLLGWWDGAEDIAKWREERDRARALLADMKKLDGECSQSSVRVARDEEKLKRERREHEERIAKLEEENEGISARIGKREGKISEKEREVEQMEADSRERSDAYFAMERDMMSVRRELEDVRARQNERKIASARVDVRVEDVEREVRAELGVPPGELSASVNEGENIGSDAERAIARLKNKLAMIGGIDPLVAEEYAETSKRYEFLVRSKEDLEEAMEHLEKVIDEMNRRIERDFARAFREIDREFSRYFKILFGGGSASLEKVSAKKPMQEEDGEEGEGEVQEKRETAWGVDICVSPPKKKVSRISLLSGGERSLVSLSILFAIIAHNPPPFAILDEVEAALDEENSRRFAELLRSLADRTQFVIITHNRETMKHADAIYGVTMKDGISQLLSVRMEGV